MSRQRPLERLLSRTTLSTQRALHSHILAIGEHYLSAASFPSSSSSSPVLPSHPPLLLDLLPSRQQQDESAHTEALLRRAREEQERALQLQQERLHAQFRYALRARERLESEERQGQRVEQQAQLEALVAGLRAELEEDKRLAVEEASRRVREEMQRERSRQAEALRKEAQECVSRCVLEAEARVQECVRKAERDRHTLQETHKAEVSHLQNRLEQLEETVVRVTGELVLCEQELKRVQCSYKQFVDLTDSSLHSDYLLQLRRLGREPGLTEMATQTDDVINVPLPTCDS